MGYFIKEKYSYLLAPILRDRLNASAIFW